ncbi:multiple RNA-binding domain-containing protein 1 [Aspergillus sclerotioniger CBS 115572]|uniref:Multiple RNA-binding domain-containing protein 1 n=1 Tax=Aspergillus sclerotioniger CBS 115572 TaxID=1450535 RepID=A0A317XDC6_9EURO|nr:multiple RNA-binding domain-containing protein 1 [Aspergillus sclerotioniger CBS 115572]PWY95607.1 multiple RNA-binding domain-containing protein 1 [Aspergillus sclerotioniger CBS 115572]
MESTRVFVSGLPPTLSDDQLRKHFATRFQVTDAHVLPKRRIGFVGFKSHEAAQQAVSYFNKTYMKMSKISVDIAKPIDAEPTRKAGKHDRTSANDATEASLKRKRDGQDAPQDARLQEYLSVMQHSSKTKTWANDDDVPKPLEKDSPPEQPAEEEEQPQELTYAQRKKAKLGDDYDQSRETHTADRQDHVSPEPMVVDHTEKGNTETPAEQDDAVAETEEQPVTDADWLRSKTSRLLGLLDEEEQAEFGTTQQKESVSADVAEDEDADSREAQIVAPAATDAGKTVKEPEVDTNIENIRLSARLFVRNLAYDTSESDLQPLFAPFGRIEEIHVAFDTRVNTSKGFAYIQYLDADAAIDAYKSLDGKHFQGRLMHILPAAAKKTYKIDDAEMAKLPLKKQKQIKRKMDATSSSFSWNSLYMNADAVMSSVAERLGVSKADLLDPTSSDAAVKQAHAETHVIQETKAYLSANGVNIEAFKQRERGNTAILVKNFSYGVKTDELRKLLEPFGQITRLLMPPSGTIAIVEFSRPDEAQKAFKGLAYRKLGDSILFLEKAPKDLFDAAAVPQPATIETKAVSQGFSTADTFAADEVDQLTPTTTLFVKNLNFATTNQSFVDLFRPLDGFVTGKVKTKLDPKRPGQTLSMGFGFVEFRTKAQAQAALAAMNGYKLDQHELVVRVSHRGMDAAEERRREDTAKKVAARRTKIIIKNLPFQATKKDVRSLFGAYGQLRSVRVPQKFDRSARGFGFADFVSAREAENAMDALKNTHLLGRKLVLEFANEEAIDAEEEIRQIEKKVGEQVDRVKLQKLTGPGRKKFTVGAQDGDED